MATAQIYYCENCGRKISGTANFCRYCGVRQTVISPEDCGSPGENSPKHKVQTVIVRPAAGIGTRKRPVPLERNIQSEYPENDTLFPKPAPEADTRPSLSPREQHFSGSYSRPGTSISDLDFAPHLSKLQSMKPEEDRFGDEDYSPGRNKPVHKFPLFARIAVIVLLLVFFFAAYNMVSTSYKPSLEVTKLLNSKKTDFSVQDFITGPLLKISDFTGIKIDNAYSTLALLCGLICIAFLFWFYYTREFW